MRRRVWVWWLLLGSPVAAPGSPAWGQESHLLVVVGLGGDPAYRELFHGWAAEMISAAEGRFGIPRDRITYLGERPG